MDDITNKFIIVVCSLSVALAVLGFGATAYLAISRSAGKMASGMERDALTEEESRYTQYDGITISGAEVVALLKRFEYDKVCLRVTHSGGSTFSYNYTDFSLGTTSSESLDDVKTFGNTHYINPSSRFSVEVEHDTGTGEISGLTFTEG